ncbi:hypothetical protein [Bartonella sp. AU55XJBT]|uniref:hypothetical protein n=1 Tax=Bartonella sp. AU55XJBT TaxID=3019091 RepID=UPI002361DB3E|nr:hypothetical protein [Bartonella sp. AU55XJBT]
MILSQEHAQSRTGGGGDALRYVLGCIVRGGDGKTPCRTEEGQWREMSFLKNANPHHLTTVLKVLQKTGLEIHMRASRNSHEAKSKKQKAILCLIAER